MPERFPLIVRTPDIVCGEFRWASPSENRTFAVSDAKSKDHADYRNGVVASLKMNDGSHTVENHTTDVSW